MTAPLPEPHRVLVREVRAETVIDASPEIIWGVLTDFTSYPEWNPFIRSIEGKLWVGTRLLVEIRPPGRRSMWFRPRVLRVAKDREFRWIGRVLIAGLFDGEHRFTIIPEGDGSRFVQAEIFTGLLVPVVDLTDTLRATHLGFLLMNRALKERAQWIAPGKPS
ncbi:MULTISPECIES: SRPBCC domain-containing protein [unclassified Methanoculleus]|uniref:SRPBCC domain-containing protein n=1 Tax=unclassified Methanoculleus TaxID=2619537 RepID=UPI0025D71E38|nr:MULTISPECIES: SRPBCC domain-containing protein [unclassified Methanoculleus]MCK9318352.1 SRPBCC domain-containing protein [Methanoculleus sp.]MDD2253256.1 SRPBCC domain-containing protein [Methanoculleus sp.]MDD2787151.1 SRPBCC domain-containing protein [Methanoculleus sp.]MDD3215506.1 SRPBCC domain-containing protein [Methanoculleus sp.]MDD4313220.1 SRPBCC domain-containing protein [Methanoculleus sp.]